MEEIVVVFDFDKTIIDVDSDNWLLDELGMGFTEMFEHLLLAKPWNTAMDIMMREVQRKGVTVDEIVGVLQRIPIHPRMVPTIKSIHSAGCCLRIVSDANRFFIETILEHLGVRSCFSSIDTNPGFVDKQQGRVRIQPYHPHFPNSPHACTNPNCAPNMCKGNVVERLISEEKSKKFIYLGDGKGDYCPCLKLRDCDIVMPRKNFPAWDLIRGEPEGVKSQVHSWGDGGDLEAVLPQLIHVLNASTAFTRLYNTAAVVDCKCESTSVPTAASHDVIMPTPLRVPF
ncbi:hypothetical protein V2J09_022381 [Rumex salicifolius]